MLTAFQTQLGSTTPDDGAPSTTHLRPGDGSETGTSDIDQPPGVTTYASTTGLVESSRIWAVTSRWIAVIPGALLSALAAAIPWHLVVLFYAHVSGLYEGQDNPGLGMLVRMIGPETIERAGLGFITPLVLISVAARIAPRFKLTTAVVASTLVVVGLAYLWFAFMLWTPTWLALRLDVIPSLVSTFLSMVAILAALKFARPWWEEGA